MRRQINPVLFIFLILMVFNSFRRGAFSSPMDWLMGTIMMIPGIIIGLSFHEFAHAWVACKLGDPTPKFQGRVTINPKAHVDPIGLIALLFAGFGWGVPVEINPSNFKNRRRDELLVSLAGVVMNLIVAIVFAIIIKILITAGGTQLWNSGLGNALWTILFYVIHINLVLMIFNLIPVPPLDGFSIITELFNLKHTELYYTVYNNGSFILLLLILLGVTNTILTPCVNFFLNLFQYFILL